MRTTGIRLAVAIVCLSLMACLVVYARADNSISDVEITTQWNATDGVPDPNGYQQVFTANAVESGIQSISVTAPNSRAYNLIPDSQYGHWEYDSQDYVSLDALHSVYPTGNYTLTIGYAGGTDTVTLPFSPTQPTPTIPFIVPNYPTATSIVAAGPTSPFAWPQVTGGNLSQSGSGIFVNLQYPDDIKIAQSGVLPLGTTSWQPSAILYPGTEYDCQAGIYNADPNSGPWLTANHNSFTYYGLCGNVNDTLFTTSAPEPGTILLLICGVVTWGLGRRLWPRT